MEDEANMELLVFIEQIGMKDISDVMEGNPDMLNIKGNTIHFVEFDTDESKWIVYLNQETDITRDRIEKILLSFFSDSWKEHFELRKRCWSEFKHNCIAYRGSQGVFYEIWKFKPGRNAMITGNILSKGQPLEVRKLKKSRSEERMRYIPTRNSLTKLLGEAGKCFLTVSQGHAPRGFGKNRPHFVPVFFPKTLTHLKHLLLAALQFDKAVRQEY
jgi:hypothetical protein